MTILLKQKHINAVVAHYSKLMGSSEYADRIKRGLFLALLATGKRFQEAMDILSHVLEDEPTVLQLRLFMSLCQHFNNNLEKAAAECSVVVGLYFFAKGDLTKAVNAYRTALELDQENEWAHYHLGMTLWALEEYSEAFSHIQEALRLRSTFSRAKISFAELKLICNHNGGNDN